MQNNKILMIINEFPPTGESGVQRPLKFLKYLAQANYETFVITPQEPVKDILDETLLADIPPSSKIFKTKSWGIKAKNLNKIEEVRYSVSQNAKSLKWKIIKTINDFIFPIDKQIGWVPFAYKEAVSLIEKEKIRNIYITSFPFSAMLVGVALKLRFGKRIFFVADYRDSWSFAPLIESKVNKLRLRTMRLVDKIILKKCDYLVSVTKPIIEEYEAYYPFLKGKTKLITNGFDEDDFIGLQAKEFSKKTILYMGKFHNHKRSPLPFLRALERYIKENKEDIDFVHIGTGPQEVFDYVKKNNLTFYKYLGYKSHQEALEYCLGADYLLLCINEDIKSKSVLSGKIFEYIKLGKPIIALVPVDGIISELINNYNLGQVSSIENEETIYEAISAIMASKETSIPQDVIRKFSRKSLTQDLIDIYEQKN